MICIAYSDGDPVSRHAAQFLIREYGIDERNNRQMLGDVELLKLDGRPIDANYIDARAYSAILFMSRHSSAAGVTSFTAHSLGNWGPDARLGGMPKALSVSSPLLMLSSIKKLRANAQADIGVVFEATHHGPFLNTPSAFIEFGGSEAAINELKPAEELGRAAIDSVAAVSEGSVECSKVAIGIGGNHYPSKFTKLAIEKEYAFGHIMPSHSFIKDGTSWNTEMIGEAFSRSDLETELAVIEWKSMGSELRTSVINKLDELGIDYERV